MTTISPTPPAMSVVAELEHRAFRALLDAMARPGQLTTLPEARPEDGRYGSALVALQALLDHEVTFHVLGAPAAHEQILRRTGARSAPLSLVDFVLVDGDRAVEAIREAREGDIEEPEAGATVVVVADALGDGVPGSDGVRLTLDGPGIADIETLVIAGVPAEAFEALRDRTAIFPEGIDVILVDQYGHVAALPRSTRIQIEQGGE